MGKKGPMDYGQLNWTFERPMRLSEIQQGLIGDLWLPIIVLGNLPVIDILFGSFDRPNWTFRASAWPVGDLRGSMKDLL